MSFGPSRKDIAAQQAAQAAAEKANRPKPMPDFTDAAVRQAKDDALKDLLKRRGRSSTIFNHQAGSGKLADQTGSPMARAMLAQRSGPKTPATTSPPRVRAALGG